MSQPKVGLQLYSIRNNCKEDLAGTLKAVAEMGYAGVEFAGYYERSAAELKKMLDDLGLACCGSHVAYKSLLPESIKETIEFNLELGNRYLVCPWVPREERPDADGWRRVADALNRAAETAKQHGLLVGYHNHTEEFKEIDGETPWDILLSHTTDDVIMQLDTGNAMHGGADPVKLLEKCAHRAVTVHLKEYSATNEKALVGEGDTDWQKVFDLCEKAGKTEWYIVEQESYAYEPLECVKRCLENLRKMGKA